MEEELLQPLEPLMPAYPEKYRVLKNKNSDTLADMVNELAHEGWEVFGYFTIAPDGVFYQVMVKQDKKTRQAVS